MVSPLQTDVSRDGVVTTVTVAGELDITAARALRHRLLELAAERLERLVLDLGGLIFVDAAGARAFDDMHRLLEAVCPVIVRTPPARSRASSGITGRAQIRSVPAVGGPGGDLAGRLETARARAEASYERTKKLRQQTESILAENQTLRQTMREACRGWDSGPAPRELLQRSAYARLVAQLQTMPVIEQAKGIIMAQSACGEAEAFDMLRRASQRSNVPVRELAAQLVAKSGGAVAVAAAKPRAPARR